MRHWLVTALFVLGIAAVLACPSSIAQDEPPPSTDTPAAHGSKTVPDVVDTDDDTPDPSTIHTRLDVPVIRAKSCILVDAATGQVLYEQNADQRLPMASTTKIMTALLFCENTPENAIITASEKAAKTRESSLHLKQGEKLSAHDLLRALLMRSANDGCVAAAEHVSGSEAAFVAKMNARAEELGAQNTHFDNPHGLHSRQHYTTARDLAIIARAALQIPRINEVVRCRRCRITRSMNVHDVTLRNHSHFLGAFPGADGVKTGWTIPAGHCYVGSATWHGWRLISVVLHSPNYVHETSALMKYGFYNFQQHTLARPGDPIGACSVSGGLATSVPVTVKVPLQVVTKKAETLPLTTKVVLDPTAAPVSAGAVVGFLEAYLGEKKLYTGLLVATAAVPHTPVLAAVHMGSSDSWFLVGTTIFAVSLVSLRYGTKNRTRFAAFTKSARKRWRRVATSLRSNDSLR